MICMYVFEAFASASQAIAEEPGHPPGILRSFRVPGAGDACYQATRMIKLIRDGELKIEDAPQWADEAWAAFVKGDNFGDRQKPGIEQAARHKEQFLEAARKWDWS